MLGAYIVAEINNHGCPWGGGIYAAVANQFREISVVITEARWATNSHGRGINSEHVNEKWKGSSDSMEPEKYWGVLKADRIPKLVFEK